MSKTISPRYYADFRVLPKFLECSSTVSEAIAEVCFLRIFPEFVYVLAKVRKFLLTVRTKIHNDPDVKDTLRRLHDDFVSVPAGKPANNMIVVCKKYYIETLINIITTNISPNSTYVPSTDSFDEILKSHCKFIESVRLEMMYFCSCQCHLTSCNAVCIAVMVNI